MIQWCKKHASACVSLVLLAALAVFGVTYHKQIWLVLTQPAARDAFVAYVRGTGVTGFLAFLGLQVLQVVVAVLPGEPVEIMAGALYGTWGGLFACQLGILVGSVAVYYCVKLAGAAAVDASVLHKYRFLRDDAHVKFALFLLYFVPGTPKDILLYIGPFMPVSARTFFAIALFARVPSVITSTYAGANIVQGNWKMSLLVFAVTGAAALLCVWQQDKILSAIKALKHRRNQSLLEKTKKP